MSVSKSNASAVVIGLDEFIGLQTARILAARGVPVIGIADDPKHFCARTNAVTSVMACNIADPALVDALRELGSTLDEKAVLFPCLDTAVRIISRHRDALAPYFRISMADNDTVETLMDKERFHRFAVSRRLPIPQTFVLQDRGDAVRAAREISFPCVFKPAFRLPQWNANVRQKGVKVTGREAFMDTYDRCAPWARTLIAQEWVEGPDSNLFQCNCYYNANSELVCAFTTRKIRTWPPNTGLGSLSQACLNNEVLAITRDLFGRVRYRGFGYAEIKRCANTGRYLIIEANIGRTTGMSALAEFCGIDMTYTWYSEMTGRPMPANELHERFEHAKWMYIGWDVRSSWYHWRRGELSVAEWARSVRGPKHFAIFSRSDLRPFASMLGAKLRGALQRRLAKRILPAMKVDAAATVLPGGEDDFRKPPTRMQKTPVRRTRRPERRKDQR